MSITQCITKSFKRELLEGEHDFTSDTFKLALYGSSASLDADTTAYTSTGEISDSGYTAGGYALIAVAPVVVGETAIADFKDLTVPNVTLTAYGGLIYNSSQSNKSVAVLDFGAARTNTGQNFVVTFPSADAINGIIRIGS